MAYWDSKQNKIIYSPSVPCQDNPGWTEDDCGCCNGIEWGGMYPRECRSCGGGGAVFRHIKSGALALYPGGPFVGRLSKENQR